MDTHDHKENEHDNDCLRRELEEDPYEEIQRENMRAIVEAEELKRETYD